MSMIATGRPTARRPCASRVIGLTLSTFRESPGAGAFDGFSTAGETGVGHEILVGVERFLPRAGNDAPARAVRKDRPALLVVEQIGEHDLVEHLLMNRGVEDREQ